MNPDQVRELFRLLEQKYSAPYIIRYRKDIAANLTDDDIAVFRRFLHDLHILDDERKRILQKLQEQGVENEELVQSIEGAENLSELFDYYVPYRPRKRARSRHAASQGLVPFALKIIEHELDHSDLAVGAQEYINPDVELHSVADVLRGVFYIISDWIAEEKSHRDVQRNIIERKGRLVAKRTGKWNRRMHDEFRDYADFAMPLSQVHHSHVLALMRGKRQNALRYRVEAPVEEMNLQAAELYLEGGEKEFYEIDAAFHDNRSLPEGEELVALSGPQLLYWCIRESIDRTLAPILGKEKERDLRKDAQEHALDIVRRNLRAKLMVCPVEKGGVLGIEPGFRTGCKLAALDEAGNIIDTRIVYPHTPKNEWDEAKSAITEMISSHGLSVACVGNSNGSRETEKLLAEIIDETGDEFRYTITECGPAEIYTKSASAGRELEGLAPKMHTAVALGRQLLRPLEELTKVSLTNLCTIPYAKEINRHQLEQELRYVAEECVGEVGPDPNTAPATLLQYVPGLNYEAAGGIIKWREENAPLETRRALREVPGFDIEMWYKAAPFMKIREAENPLDATRIHPDHYRVALAILKQLGMEPDELRDAEKRAAIGSRRKEIKLTELEDQFDIHYLSGKEILSELIDPWPDPRRDMPSRALRQGPLTFHRIAPFQMLRGTVKKVVDFGAFVDIGVGEDGLVHVSELSEEFVESPYDIIFAGEEVTVWVVDISPESRRIALSMRSKESAQKAAQKREKIKQQKESMRRVEQKKKEAYQHVPTARLPSSMQQAKAAAGQQSQRMKKIREFGGQSTGTASDAGRKEDGKKVGDDDKKAQSEEERASGSDLLKRLQFASIEKRGEDR